MLKRILVLMFVLCCTCSVIARADETGAQIKAKAEAAVAQHRWQDAYSLYLSAQSAYISEDNQKAADEMGQAAEQVQNSGMRAPPARQVLAVAAERAPCGLHLHRKAVLRTAATRAAPWSSISSACRAKGPARCRYASPRWSYCRRSFSAPAST